MSEDWDVVVVDADPAGSSVALAALRARPDVRVLLLDRQEFPRDKSCGDAVAPHTVDLPPDRGAGEASAARPRISDLALASSDGVSVQRRIWRAMHVVSVAAVCPLAAGRS